MSELIKFFVDYSKDFDFSQQSINEIEQFFEKSKHRQIEDPILKAVF